MTDVTGTTSYSYDTRDRLLSKTDAWSNGPVVSLNYRYDSNGNLTNLWSSPSGGVTNVFQYDPLNRLTNVLASGVSAASYTFDPSGNLQTEKYGNGVTNVLQYDSLNRLTNLIWKLNASTLASFYYRLGATGTRTNLSENLNGTGRTNAWSYDSLYRLTNETFSGGTSGSLSYGFDLVSNRTNRTSTVGGLTNQAFIFNPNDYQTNTDAYDSNGNTLSSSGNSYQYDPLNHPTNATTSGVLLWYDGDGNRVRRTYNGTNMFYLIDDRNPTGYAQALEEWVVGGGATNLSRTYNYGLQPVSQKTGTTTFYLAQDGHGSTRLLLDTSGAVSQWFVFDAYGSLIASNAVPLTPIGYSGEYFDPVLGLGHFRKREINVGMGRFLTADPFEGRNEHPLSLHKYLYGGGNPVMNSDPMGTDFSAVEMTSDIGTLNILSSFRLALPSTGVSLGKGGPEVTDALKRTLDEVSTTFVDRWTPRQKALAQERIQGPAAGDSWDIQQLQDVDAVLQNYIALGSPNYECAEGVYAGTVTVNKECYYAGAVNYALWGRIWRVCNDYYGGTAFSLARAKGKVAFYKTFMYGMDTAAQEALAFTEYGYNGKLPMKGLPRATPSGRVVKENFDWVWEPIHSRGS